MPRDESETRAERHARRKEKKKDIQDWLTTDASPKRSPKKQARPVTPDFQVDEQVHKKIKTSHSKEVSRKRRVQSSTPTESSDTSPSTSKGPERRSSRSKIKQEDITQDLGKSDVKNILKTHLKLEPLDDNAIIKGLESTINGYIESPTSYKEFRNGFDANRIVKREVPDKRYDPTIGVTSKKTKMAVFAGTSKRNVLDHVPTLEQLCLNILADNLDHIECLGNAPYHVLSGTLSKCTPQQLSRIEHFNRDNDLLLEDMDELWKAHCKREFSQYSPERYEDWRSVYHRAVKERAHKLAAVSNQIKKKAEMAKEPIKKTMAINAIAATSKSQTAFLPLDGSARLPANSRSSSFHGHSSLASKAAAIRANISAPQPTAASIKAAGLKSRQTTAAKPKMAPLMKKSMMMLKKKFK